MRYIFMLVPIGAVWLLSANEQGLVGNWAIWTSLLLWILFGVGAYLTEQEKGV